MSLSSVLRALVLMLAAVPAAAQDMISPDAFLNRVEGRTAQFDLYPFGGLVGTEQFLSRTRSVWARSNGTCSYGAISVRDQRICFVYDDEPGRSHCWFPLAHDERLFVLDDDGSEVQEVTRIFDAPVICTDAPLS